MAEDSKQQRRGTILSLPVDERPDEEKGYRVAEKESIEALLQKDQDDESDERPPRNAGDGGFAAGGGPERIQKVLAHAGVASRR